MADRPAKREPNLELPSLFGRRRKKEQASADDAPGRTADTAPVEADPAPVPAPVQGSTRRLPPTPPPVDREQPARDAAPEPTASEPVAEEPVAEEPAEQTAVLPAAEPVAGEPETHEPAADEAPGDGPAESAARVGRVGPGPVAPPAATPAALDSDSPTQQRVEDEPSVEGPRRRRVRERRPITLPRIPAALAALVTGLVTGLVGVVLALGAQQGCEAVRGVGSCGGTGLVALLVVVLVEVLIGSVLLKAFGLSDPTSTSFLAVGLVAVLALLFFLGSLESPAMLIVIPVLTAIMFVVSWWVTENVVQPGAGDNLHR